MSAQPDRALMRAVAETVVNEERARIAADSVLAADLMRLGERIEEIGMTVVSPELAAQIKTAIRLLHESPPTLNAKGEQNVDS